MSRDLHLLMAGIATVGLQALMLSPMLTDIMRSLDAGPAEMGAAAGAYGFGVAASAFLAAPRLDFWPRRLMLRLGFLAMAIALLLCGLAWNVTVLLSGQFLIGAAAGIVIPVSYALASDLSPESYRTQALGRVVLGWSVALCLGVPLSAILTDALGWRLTFLAVATLALAACLAFARLPEPERRGNRGRIGYAEAFAARGVPPLLFGTFAFMAAFYGTYSFLGDHLRVLHGAGAWLGGVVAMSYGLGFGLGTLADAWINRVGPARIATAALLCVCLNYLILPFAADSIPAIVGYALVWGFIAHIAMTSLVAALSRSPEPVRGAVIALFSVTTYLAQGVAGLSMGWVYGVSGFAAASWIVAALAALSAALLLASRTRG